MDEQKIVQVTEMTPAERQRFLMLEQQTWKAWIKGEEIPLNAREDQAQTTFDRGVSASVRSGEMHDKKEKEQ